MAKDDSNHVKISLAEVIFEVARFCESSGKMSPALEGIMEVVKTLMKDQDTTVRLTLVKHLHLFNKQIGKDNTAEHVVPLLKDMTKDPKWRFRHELLKAIPSITESLTLEEFKELYEDFQRSFIFDHAFQVREQLWKNFNVFSERYGGVYVA